MNRTVLISGAGIAGPTLAYWLARYDFAPTVVERAEDLRSSGNPVDVRGRALDVAQRMGIMPQLRAAATAVERLTLVDGRGRRLAAVRMQNLAGARTGLEVELPRGDLAAILYQASRDRAEYIFHDAIRTLAQDEAGVDVTFLHGGSRRFDLVIGADGLHSAVRRLAFGPEAGFVEPLGMFVAALPLDGADIAPDEVLIYNTPGRLVALHPSRGRALAAFVFHSRVGAAFDPHDASQPRQLLAASYAGAAWRVPELLQRVHAAPDLYFDAIARVNVPCWWRGRVALLGDAAACVSLFGDGSSSALFGAFTLARALADVRDHVAAFRRYEAEHRAIVAPKLRHVRRAAGLLVPATATGLWARNLTARAWQFAASARKWQRAHASRPARQPS